MGFNEVIQIYSNDVKSPLIIQGDVGALGIMGNLYSGEAGWI